MATTEIIQHGIQWINGGDAVCPECKMPCTREHLIDIVEEDDRSGNQIVAVLVATFDCPKCRCRFRISRPLDE